MSLWRFFYRPLIYTVGIPTLHWFSSFSHVSSLLAGPDMMLLKMSASVISWHMLMFLLKFFGMISNRKALFETFGIAALAAFFSQLPPSFITGIYIPFIRWSEVFSLAVEGYCAAHVVFYVGMSLWRRLGEDENTIVLKSFILVVSAFCFSIAVYWFSSLYLSEDMTVGFASLMSVALTLLACILAYTVSFDTRSTIIEPTLLFFFVAICIMRAFTRSLTNPVSIIIWSFVDILASVISLLLLPTVIMGETHELSFPSNGESGPFKRAIPELFYCLVILVMTRAYSTIIRSPGVGFAQNMAGKFFSFMGSDMSLRAGTWACWIQVFVLILRYVILTVRRGMMNDIDIVGQ